MLCSWCTCNKKPPRIPGTSRFGIDTEADEIGCVRNPNTSIVDAKSRLTPIAACRPGRNARITYSRNYYLGCCQDILLLKQLFDENSNGRKNASLLEEASSRCPPQEQKHNFGRVAFALHLEYSVARRCVSNYHCTQQPAGLHCDRVVSGARRLLSTDLDV